MNFFDIFFRNRSNKNSNVERELPDQIELHYDYVDTAYREEGAVEYPVNVTVEFLLDLSGEIYEVSVYSSSPNIDYVDVPDYQKLESDVNSDLRNRNINFMYIPNIDNWNFY